MDLLHAAHVPAGEGPFPTVLALHGWGASAHDLIGLAPILNRGEALVLSPQGPVVIRIPDGSVGYGWYPLGEGARGDPVEMARASELVLAFLDAAQERYPIDPRKIVLLGFSQGGALALDLALRDPSRFAGLAGLSCWLPDPLAEQIQPDSAHQSLPVLVVHGTEDPMVPVDRARESRQQLTRLGVVLTYREYQMAHEISVEALRDIVTWLDEKALNPIQLV
jgi:phospholipase/carboxylesterase